MAAIYGYTTNYRLVKNTFQAYGWHTDHWANLDTIDSIIASAGAAIPFVGVPTGTADAILLDFTPNVAYTSGQQISFIAVSANTAAVTVNCDGLGAKSLLSASGVALVANQITANMYVRAVYNGTNFIIIFPATGISFNNIITNGTSGVVTPTNADDLTIEHSIDVGMSFNTPAGYAARINFGRPLSVSAGGIRYDHATDIMHFRTAGADNIQIGATGILTLPATVGRVIEPGRPAFYAHYSGTTAGFPVTGGDLQPSTELADNTNSYTSATGRFTAPVAGIYEFFAHFAQSCAVGGTTIELQFYKNGAAIGLPNRMTYDTINPKRQHSMCQIMTSLVATDYITVRVVSAVLPGASLDWSASFSGKLIG